MGDRNRRRQDEEVETRKAESEVGKSETASVFGQNVVSAPRAQPLRFCFPTPQNTIVPHPFAAEQSNVTGRMEQNSH